MPARTCSEPPDGDPPEPRLGIRDAVMTDLPRLLDIENLVFPGDRLSRRSFRHLLGRARAINLVASMNGEVAGYITVLLRSSSRGARIYSLAVDPRWQGRRIGPRLMEAAESRAADRGCAFIRLEVRADNDRAIRQYDRAGYHRIGQKPAYYEDGEPALLFEKRLPAAENTGPN